MADCTSPIGVFDSGVGGIGTLAQLLHELPCERFIYYGDTAHAPYGTKPTEEVMGYIRQVVAKLLEQDVKAIVIACNTATSVAAAQLRAEMPDFPIIGIEPALKPASELRQDGTILVLATPVTLHLPKFAALMEKYGEGAVPLPCPGLMELVENMDFDGAQAYLTDLLSNVDLDCLDAVVLGCTHYVFLRPVLKKILPRRVAVLDGNMGVARQLRRVLDSRGMLNTNGCGGVEMQTSGENAKEVQSVMEKLLRLANGL